MLSSVTCVDEAESIAAVGVVDASVAEDALMLLSAAGVEEEAWVRKQVREVKIGERGEKDTTRRTERRLLPVQRLAI